MTRIIIWGLYGGDTDTHLAHVGAVGRGAGEAGVGSEADLYKMHCVGVCVCVELGEKREQRGW